MNQLNEKFNKMFNIEVDTVVSTKSLSVNEKNEIVEDFVLVKNSKVLILYDTTQKKAIYSNILNTETDKEINEQILHWYKLWIESEGNYYDFLDNFLTK